MLAPHCALCISACCIHCTPSNTNGSTWVGNCIDASPTSKRIGPISLVLAYPSLCSPTWPTRWLSAAASSPYSFLSSYSAAMRLSPLWIPRKYLVVELFDMHTFNPSFFPLASSRCDSSRRWYSYRTCASAAIPGVRPIAYWRSSASSTSNSNVSDNSSNYSTNNNSNICSGSSSENTIQWCGVSIHIRVLRHRRMLHNSSRDSGNIVMLSRQRLMWHERVTHLPHRRTVRRLTPPIALSHLHMQQCVAIHHCWCPRLCRVHRVHRL